jgi:hypothetical protein
MENNFLHKILLIFSLSLLATCGNPSQSEPLTSYGRPEINVVGSTDGYSNGCSPQDAAILILQFFEAYNEGNQEQLVHFFEPRLSVPGLLEGWYSDTIIAENVGNKSDRRHFVSSSREDLLAYFAERHAQFERVQLLSLDVHPTSNTRIDVSYTYMRQANDVQPGPNGVGRMGDGKGVIKCPDQKIGIWSMGTAAPEEDEDYYLYACNGSRIDPTATEIIVCGKLGIEKQ